MSKIIDLFSQPWMGTIFGFLGIIAATFFYKKSRRVSKLVSEPEHPLYHRLRRFRVMLVVLHNEI